MLAKAIYSKLKKRYTNAVLQPLAFVGAVLCVTNWLYIAKQIALEEFAVAYQALVKNGALSPENQEASEEKRRHALLRGLDNLITY